MSKKSASVIENAQLVSEEALALKSFLDSINAKTPPSYEQASDGLQISLGAIKTLIHRLRKCYIALLREEVGRTVSHPPEIDGQLRALPGLIASEERLDP